LYFFGHQKKYLQRRGDRTNQQNEATMSKHKLWVGWVAGVMAAVAQAAGPSVDVSVNASTGAVTVTPATVVVAATDDSVTWTMSVRSHRFAASGGVSVPSSSTYSCVNQDNNSKVVCTRTTRVVGSFAYSLNVVPVGSAPPAGGAPYGWLQNE
jgi:plastocyanin